MKFIAVILFLILCLAQEGCSTDGLNPERNVSATSDVNAPTGPPAALSPSPPHEETQSPLIASESPLPPSEPEPSPEAPVPPPTSQEAPVSPSPGLPSVEELGKVISAKDIGTNIIGSSYIFWSPKGNYLVFIGYDRDSYKKYTPGVYVYNSLTGETRKVIEGQYDKNYYLLEPQWSEDESLAAIPFYELSDTEYPVYIYNTDSGDLANLPVNGFSPSISPDGSTVAYFAKDGLSLYTIAENQTRLIPGNIQGFYPIWFSDNKRIAFLRRTGNNPSGLEGAELEDISIIDITNPSETDSLGFAAVYRSICWIEPDKLAWVISGYDDGYFAGFLDFDTRKLVDLGDGWQSYYQYTPDVSIIRFAELNGFELLDSNLKRIAFWPADKADVDWEGWRNAFLCLSPDGNLFYLRMNCMEFKGMIMVSGSDEKTRQLTGYSEYFYAAATHDGSKMAFSNNADKLVIINSEDLEKLLIK